MIEKLVKTYEALSPGARTFIVTVRNFVLLYAGMMAENQVQVISNGEWFPKEWGHAAVIFALFVAFGLLSHQIRIVHDRRTARERARTETMAYAESLIDQDITEACRRAELAVHSSSTAPLVAALIASPENIQRIITKVYQVFESRFAESNRMQDRVNFEVTFMTKSLRDGGITIPAFANRDGRQPTSMQQRAGNPKHYEKTVTASIYLEEHPKLQIIPDTYDKTVRYAELYAGQKERIRSSIVYPILSPQNRLLGTLVAHCDRANFFTETDRKFWDDLMHVFARRLAFEKVKLDAVYGGECVVARLTPPAPSETPF
jgi:hypothetical protein